MIKPQPNKTEGNQGQPRSTDGDKSLFYFPGILAHDDTYAAHRTTFRVASWRVTEGSPVYEHRNGFVWATIKSDGDPIFNFDFLKN